VKQRLHQTPEPDGPRDPEIPPDPRNNPNPDDVPPPANAPVQEPTLPVVPVKA
jgi:hypothetical protein